MNYPQIFQNLNKILYNFFILRNSMLLNVIEYN